MKLCIAILLLAVAGSASAKLVNPVCLWFWDGTQEISSTPDNPYCPAGQETSCDVYPVNECSVQEVYGIKAYGQLKRGPGGNMVFQVSLTGPCPSPEETASGADLKPPIIVEVSDFETNKCEHVTLELPSNIAALAGGAGTIQVSVFVEDSYEVEETTTTIPCPACTEGEENPVCHTDGKTGKLTQYANKECAKCYVKKWKKGACKFPDTEAPVVTDETTAPTTTKATTTTTAAEITCPKESNKKKCKKACKKADAPLNKYKLTKKDSNGCKNVCDCVCDKAVSAKKCKKQNKKCKKEGKVSVHYKGTTHPSGCKDVCQCE